MKSLIVLLIAVTAASYAYPSPADDEKYTTKYDNINIDDILASERLLQNYYACLMEEGKCTPDGEELRRVLPEALETECAKCSDKQKDGSKKVIKFLINNKPDMWKKMMEKYDPEGKYKEKYQKYADKEGIQV